MKFFILQSFHIYSKVAKMVEFLPTPHLVFPVSFTFVLSVTFILWSFPGNFSCIIPMNFDQIKLKVPI